MTNKSTHDSRVFRHNVGRILKLLYGAFLFVSGFEYEINLQFYPLWILIFSTRPTAVQDFFFLRPSLFPKTCKNKSTPIECSKITLLQLWWGMVHFSHTESPTSIHAEQ